MTSNEQAIYEREVGNLVLTAFSLDPKISIDDIVKLVRLRDVPIDLSQAAQQRPIIKELSSIDELSLNVLEERYEVPEEFRYLRQSLEERLVLEGKTNGPVIIVSDPIQHPLKVKQGGYFDFQATSVEIPEVRNIMEEYDTPVTKLARYLGFGYFVRSGGGQEVLFVHRSPNVGIVKDVMSLNGSTPAFNDNFYRQGFDINGYLTGHIEDKMKADFGLDRGEFSIGMCYLMDEVGGNNPIVAMEIQTQLSAKEIAGRVYQREATIKKHPIIYALSDKGEYQDLLNSLVRLPMYPHAAHVVDTFVKPKGNF